MIPPPPWQERTKAYVYLLRSLNTARFYLGWTTDLKRRIEEHNSRKSEYTKARGPWELISYEEYHDIQSAQEREYKLKHSPRMFQCFKKRALATLRVSAAMRQNMEVVG
ncbi:MAG: GIY-YIG nuclease family protein [Candidatus Omnitrophica bacterium]|nr:GIY-YIG nuclease family protein [Candidatus Omnitrophota bacterium]